MSFILNPARFAPTGVEIENSALLKTGSSQTLSRSLGSAGNRRTFTISVWINPNLALHAGSAYNPYIYGFDAASSNDHGIQINNEAIRFFNRTSGTFDVDLRTNGLVRDIGWLHIVAALDTTATVNRAMLYINGIQASLATNTQPSLNLDTHYNNASQIIGGSSGKYFDGYMAEFVMVEGSQLGPTSFGEFDSTGLYWTPKSSNDIKALTFGTNGFYLDNTTNAQTDASGEGNNFTNNNTVTTNPHTPTNMYGLLNTLSLTATYPGTISGGNLTFSGNASGYWSSGIYATLPCEGKFYWEAKATSLYGTNAYLALGVAPMDLARIGGGSGVSPGGTSGVAGGSLFFNGGSTTNLWSNGLSQNDNIYSSLTISTNDVMQVAFDASNGKLWYGKNDTWYNSGDPANGTNPSSTLTATDKTWMPWFGSYTANSTWVVNFGASSFAETKPSGFDILNTTNLASATTRTASDTTKYFQTVLYEGNGASQRVGQFQPFTDSFTVAKSALFQTANSESLTRTPSGAGNRRTWTFSTWIKFASDGSSGFTIFNGYGSASDTGTLDIVFVNDNIYLRGWSTNYMISNLKPEDTSQWGNLVMMLDTTQSTSTDRVKGYWNGVELTWSTASYPSQNVELGINQAVLHSIGAFNNASGFMGGYLAETVFVDGTSLTASSFGQTDTSSNRWIPKAVSGLSLGTNGFYLDYSDSSDLGEDQTGSNDFTNNNTVTQTGDSPTTNVATLDPNSNVTSGGTTALSNGNRTSTQSSGGTTYVGGTLVPESGKFVWEVTVTNVVDQFYIGIKDILGANPASSSLADDAIMYQNDGTIDVDGTTYSSSPATYTDGDVIRVEWDVNVKIEWFKNNSSQGSYTLLKSPITYKPFFVYNDNTASFTVNFGASSFAHTPTTGYSALTQDNMTSTDQFISAFSWIKNRDATDNHMLFDRVRGVTKDIHSNTDDVQVTNTQTVQQFLSAGVQVGDDVQVNTANESYALWNFMMEATGSGSSNEDGSINTTATLVDTTLGMSISTYTGTGSNATVGHGLGVAPEVIIVKEITGGASNWQVYNKSIGNTKVLYLNLAIAAATDSAFQDTSPTSSVFSIGTGGDINGSGNTYIAYCFAPSQFIAMGSYTGNENVNGPFVPTLNSLGVPIQPVWVMVKNTAQSRSWNITDTARNPYNVANYILEADTTTAQQTGSDTLWNMDIVTGGFKLRSSHETSNGAEELIYLAIGTPIIDTDGKIIAGRL